MTLRKKKENNLKNVFQQLIMFIAKHIQLNTFFQIFQIHIKTLLIFKQIIHLHIRGKALISSPNLNLIKFRRFSKRGIRKR